MKKNEYNPLENEGEENKKLQQESSSSLLGEEKNANEKVECVHCPKEESIESCCSVAKKEESIKSCCSPAKEEEPLGSCCAPIKEEEPVGACCAPIKKEESIGSCCVPIEKEEPLGSCCAPIKKEESIGSCCVPIEKEEPLGSCCAPIKKESSSGACYHSTGNTAETCCGTVNLDKQKRKKDLTLLIISVLSVVASFLFSRFEVYHALGSQYWAILDPAWIAIAISGSPLYIAAYQRLKRRKITSALLVSMAMTASIVVGFLVIFGMGDANHAHGGTYFFAAGEVAVIMAIGAFLENITIGKSRSAIEELISMKPTRALRKDESGEYVSVDVSLINLEDEILVRPNEIIPIDGKILSGESAVDFSSINGEYIPAELKKGDGVYAGTRNMSGALEIVATKKSDETTLSRLIAYVKEAEKKKAPVVRIADKWASYLVITSLFIAIAVFFISLFGFKISGMEAVQRAATVLVVFCPCALALATPIAVAAGIGSASKKGILVKSGSALEAIARIDTIAFDKTGTLTEGKLRVEEVFPYGMSEENLLLYAASAEAKSEHPLAKAIIQAYGKELLESENTTSLIGKGVEAIVEGRKIGVYKIEYIRDSIPQEEYQSIPLGGRTVVGVIIEGKYAGAIAISDTLRKNIKEVIEEIKGMGIKTVMLTGDSQGAAGKVGEETGIERVKYELLPEQKVEAIEELKGNNHKVLMIGDGVNDAAALAASDCSLAIGAMGSSVAMETAEASLLSEDMRKIPVLLRLSKRTLLTIKINITLSLTISFIAILLSMFGKIDAVIGALVHNGSSTLVCLHSALLLLYKGESRLKKKKILNTSY